MISIMDGRLKTETTNNIILRDLMLEDLEDCYYWNLLS